MSTWQDLAHLNRASAIRLTTHYTGRTWSAARRLGSSYDRHICHTRAEWSHAYMSLQKQAGAPARRPIQQYWLRE